MDTWEINGLFVVETWCICHGGTTPTGCCGWLQSWESLIIEKYVSGPDRRRGLGVFSLLDREGARFINGGGKVWLRTAQLRFGGSVLKLHPVCIIFHLIPKRNGKRLCQDLTFTSAKYSKTFYLFFFSFLKHSLNGSEGALVFWGLSYSDMKGQRAGQGSAHMVSEKSFERVQRK